MSIDDLARDLASGTISRRTALRRLAAGALGIGLAAAPTVLAEELERGNCPKSRRCGKKCCPKGAKCKNGKCKCKAGKKKCGKSCVDLESSQDHCGSCNTPCNEDETCVGGECTPNTICGNDVVEGEEECDGNDLNGMSCSDLGFDGGTLACDNGCTFDTSGCFILEGCGSRECGQAPNGEQCGNCGSGEFCTADGFCQPAAAESCNGIDDDGDDQIDEDFQDLGQTCECSPGVFGVRRCNAAGTGTECVCP